MASRKKISANVMNPSEIKTKKDSRKEISDKIHKKPTTQKKQPGIQKDMEIRPKSAKSQYLPSNKLLNKVAVITGGDSGIGRAVAILFAQEGADIVISYLNEKEDAEETRQTIEKLGRKCLLIAGDIGNEKVCKKIIKTTIDKFSKINILVNNAAEQHTKSSIEEITKQQLESTFRSNIFSFFYLTREAVPFLKKGACIINTTSVTAYKGNPALLDYSTTKGAIVSFTRSLSLQLIKKGIRVNAVAPGPIWTPLIPATLPKGKIAKFAEDTPIGRIGQPEEVATCYLFLASEDSSYINGQVLHPNGGIIVNG